MSSYWPYRPISRHRSEFGSEGGGRSRPPSQLSRAARPLTDDDEMEVAVPRRPSVVTCAHVDPGRGDAEAYLHEAGRLVHRTDGTASREPDAVRDVAAELDLDAVAALGHAGIRLPGAGEGRVAVPLGVPHDRPEHVVGLAGGR